MRLDSGRAFAYPHAMTETTEPKTPAAERLAAVAGLILDCDGVLTPGGLYYADDGRRWLRFDARDGFGIAALCRSGIPVAVLSGRPADIAELRLRELGVTLFEGRCHDKTEGIARICEQMGIEPSACAYVGDDLPDLAAFAAAGLAIAVADAASELLEAADWVTRSAGGRGAVREICEALLKAQGKWQRLLERVSAPGAKPRVPGPKSS